MADYSSEKDLDWAAQRIAAFSNYQAGQSCISVQRVFADRAVYDKLVEKVVEAVEAQKTGDPADGATDVGPMISTAAAERVEAWVEEAVGAGATLLTGGVRDGASYEPTVIAGAPARAKVVTEEVFGPVLVVRAFDGADEAVRAGQRLAVRPAGRRLHQRPAHRVPHAPRSGGRRCHHRRRS